MREGKISVGVGALNPSLSPESYRVKRWVNLYVDGNKYETSLYLFILSTQRAWHIVYRANAGCGENVLNTFLSDDVINEDTPTMQSSSADVNGVYKSSAITTGRWQDITEVVLNKILLPHVYC